jgi:putative N-acetylmannosamine-6-phosphate epimerase
VFAIAAGWIAGLVAQAVPGAHLDQSQIVAFMAAAAASALAAGWKWLQGWQQHEALVARGLDVPVKQGQSPQAVLAAGTSSAPSASPASH